ncbi:hypothetical protein [Achromobacter aloeverae]
MLTDLTIVAGSTLAGLRGMVFFWDGELLGIERSLAMAMIWKSDRVIAIRKFLLNYMTRRQGDIPRAGSESER